MQVGAEATAAGALLDNAGLSPSAKAARANRLKDEFLAALSHELRTPLNTISSGLTC